MRIAISGTHCCGKSTLIEEFLLVHSDFTHEPEAYEALEDYGESFAADPSAEDFLRQLEYNMARLNQYQSGDRVIFERCPADYLAYLFALVDLGRDRDASGLLPKVVERVQTSLSLLDVIVFLPALDLADEMEDPKLRSAVNARLESILVDDELDVFASGHPVVIEAAGSTKQRLLKLEAALELK
jgi:AAA domain